MALGTSVTARQAKWTTTPHGDQPIRRNLSFIPDTVKSAMSEITLAWYVGVAASNVIFICKRTALANGAAYRPRCWCSASTLIFLQTSRALDIASALTGSTQRYDAIASTNCAARMLLWQRLLDLMRSGGASKRPRTLFFSWMQRFLQAPASAS